MACMASSLSPPLPISLSTGMGQRQVLSSAAPSMGTPAPQLPLSQGYLHQVTHSQVSGDAPVARLS